MAAQPIPERYNSLSPVLSVDDAAQAIEFYKRPSAPASGDAFPPRRGRSPTPKRRPLRKVCDPFAHDWHIATHVEDLSTEEIAERGKEAMAGLDAA